MGRTPQCRVASGWSRFRERRFTELRLVTPVEHCAAYRVACALSGVFESPSSGSRSASGAVWALTGGGAAPFSSGTVVRDVDGAPIIVRGPGGRTEDVRLLGIDAPEHRTRGNRARSRGLGVRQARAARRPGAANLRPRAARPIRPLPGRVRLSGSRPLFVNADHSARLCPPVIASRTRPTRRLAATRDPSAGRVEVSGRRAADELAGRALAANR